MNATTSDTFLSRGRDWSTAFAALRKLLGNADDTVQVFRIVRALNGGTARKGYERMLGTFEGGRIAFAHVEMAERLSDPAYVAQFAEGSVGAAYRDFLQRTGYSATGLADVSRSEDEFRDADHPYAWFGRRNRDLHDVWHVLTGYQADDPLGEACLVAFTFAQNGGLGLGLIAAGAAVKGMLAGGAGTRAILEGYRRGKAARWLVAEDYDRLLAEPLDVARQRLGIAAPRYYTVG